MPKRLIKPSYFISRATSTDSGCCHLPTAMIAFSATTQKTHAPTGFDQQAQVSQRQTSCTNKENRNTEVHGGGGLELVKPAREPASSRSKPCAFLKNAPRVLLARCPLLAVVVERKQTLVRDQLFPQKPPGSRRLWFSRTGVQHPHGSSTIEPPSAFAKSGANPPDRALPGSPRQCPLPSARHHLPKGTALELGRGAHLRNTIILNQPYRSRASTGRLDREDSQLATSLEGLHPPKRPSHNHTPTIS